MQALLGNMIRTLNVFDHMHSPCFGDGRNLADYQNYFSAPRSSNWGPVMLSHAGFLELTGCCLRAAQSIVCHGLVLFWAKKRATEPALKYKTLVSAWQPPHFLFFTSTIVVYVPDICSRQFEFLYFFCGTGNHGNTFLLESIVGLSNASVAVAFML